MEQTLCSASRWPPHAQEPQPHSVRCTEHLAQLSGRVPPDGAYLLPVPMMNILNGGAHADSSVDLQEFMVMPLGLPTFAEALRAGTEIFHALRSILKKAGHSTGVGDEGGFAPNLKSNREALDLVVAAIGKAGFAAGRDIFVALDVASSELWDNGKYVFKKSGEATRSADEMVQMYTEWVRDYPIVSIEDGVAEGDWDGWKALTRVLGNRVQLVGDDVFVTNPEILRRGISEGVGNSLLVKLNQIGTVSRNLRRDRDGTRRRLHDDHLAPVGGDRGYDHRRPCRRNIGGADQDRIREPQ